MVVRSAYFLIRFFFFLSAITWRKNDAHFPFLVEKSNYLWYSGTALILLPLGNVIPHEFQVATPNLCLQCLSPFFFSKGLAFNFFPHIVDQSPPPHPSFCFLVFEIAHESFM